MAREKSQTIHSGIKLDQQQLEISNLRNLKATA